MPDAAAAQLKGVYSAKKKDDVVTDAGKRTKPFVIGASFPRTGTNSLKLALEYLGFGKCYHIQEMCENNELDKWDVKGDYKNRNFENLPPFKELFRGYNA